MPARLPVNIPASATSHQWATCVQRCLQLARACLPELADMVSETDPSAVVEHGMYTRLGREVRYQQAHAGLHAEVRIFVRATDCDNMLTRLQP